MANYFHRKFLISCWASVILNVMSIDMNEFFPDVKGNLTKITWAHAVNNATFLNTVLNDSNIMMIEADVSVGTINNKVIPIMSHNGNTSDLSLEDFLSKVNDNESQNKKGVKLDFKTIDAFEKSVPILKKYENNSFPIWLNADILRGPDSNATATPVEADQFLSLAINFAYTTLSVGWTTTNNANLPYTSLEVDEMVKLLQSNNNITTKFSITFPVRAILAAKSFNVLNNLLSKVEGSTLTLWSGTDDADIDIDGLRSLISEVGIKKTYIDVPDSLLSQLHIDTLKDGAGSLNFSYLTATLLILFSVILNI